MARISSKTVTLNQPADQIFAFLSDLNNLQHLMPEDRVENWTSTTDTCSFQIKGLARIGMRIAERNEPSLIHIVSDGKNPFDFTLNIHLDGQEAQTEGHFVFDGQMNPFMKMMVEKPLTNFFNMLADKLAELKG